ncbi:HigA family addiction module antitoxin [Stenotrophomonas oahuensis]|mgnify:FL=1|uniref:HigA family addiction module antitoxin n=1 Tax=Stenotrophomonas oahuensis TaxID=3003271 RepID=A0ABY9YRZ7_9GAMM|nr:HigA family addiction module antitoxin [Stenotrophomonas sp. A5586]WNH53497.1 HigA family addiction module antitoxin [Stenotrophomonas sp. A5586]
MSRPTNKLRAIHPGEVLREEFLLPLELSINALARALDVPATRLHAIVHETRGITADTAARLARHFGGDAASWLALQAEYDLKTLATWSEIESRVQPRVAA